jgi:hypothetical protein
MRISREIGELVEHFIDQDLLLVCVGDADQSHCNCLPEHQDRRSTYSGFILEGPKIAKKWWIWI